MEPSTRDRWLQARLVHPQMSAALLLQPLGCNRRGKEENGRYDSVPSDGVSFVSPRSKAE